MKKTIEQEIRIRREQRIAKLKILAVQMGPEIVDMLEYIHSQELFFGISKKFSFSFLQFKLIPTESHMCSKILVQHDYAFRCFDCQYLNGAALCPQCFQASDHKGHNFEIFRISGGCCDCGDQQKWNPKGFCKKHTKQFREFEHKINPQQQEKFRKQLSFCFAYYFCLYNEAYSYPRFLQNQKEIQKIRHFEKKVSAFQQGLIGFLCQFNKNSLISCRMTYKLFKSKITQGQFNFEFVQDYKQKSILEILLKTTEYGKCMQKVEELFFQMFPLQQFKTYLTVAIINEYNKNPAFVRSPLQDIVCQLVASCNTIPQLIDQKAITPLVYEPYFIMLDSFQQLFNQIARCYYSNLKHLLTLYGKSAQKYVNFHILEGKITSLGYYRNFTFNFKDSSQFYRIEQINLVNIFKLIKAIKSSQIKIYEKALQDLWQKCIKLYKIENKSWYEDLKKDQHQNESVQMKKIYLTYEITFGVFVFAYFQKLSQQYVNMTIQEKIQKLVNLLKINSQKGKQFILSMIDAVNNNILLSGLSSSFPSFSQQIYIVNFKIDTSLIAILMYVYKILGLMLKCIFNEQPKIQQLPQKLTKEAVPQVICSQFMIKRSIQKWQNLITQSQKTDDRVIKIQRLKYMIGITYFINFLIQASQTDLHELIIASRLKYTDNQKYTEKVNEFYLNLLKICNKIPLKDFKNFAEYFISDEEGFEKFVFQSKEIIIDNGNISIKNQQHNSSIQGQQNINSQINEFYFPFYKQQIRNLSNQKEGFKTPQISHHYLHQFLSEKFISKILELFKSHIQTFSNQKQQIGLEINNLKILVIELIKIGKAFFFKPESSISLTIFDFLKEIKQNEKYRLIFNDEIKKLILIEAQIKVHEKNEHSNLFKKQQNEKNEERKRKMQLKKQKMLSKMKQTHQKYQQKYENEFRSIEENSPVKQNKLSQQKFCIICRQSEQQKQLMLMYFMQKNNLFETLVKMNQNVNIFSHDIFTCCGHFIHRQCYQKIDINAFEKFEKCKLCKKPYNLLFPICDEMTYLQNKVQQQQVQQQIFPKKVKQFFQSLKYAISVFICIKQQLQPNCVTLLGYGIKQVHLKIIYFLVIEIIFILALYKPLKQTNIIKEKLKICRNMLNALKIYQTLEKKESFEKNNKTDQKCLQQNNNSPNKTIKELIQAITLVKIRDFLKIGENYQNQYDISKRKLQQIRHKVEIYLLEKIKTFILDNELNSKSKENASIVSLQFQQIIESFFDKMVSSSDEQQFVDSFLQKMKLNESEEINVFSEKLRLFEPPQTLSELVKLRGKCKSCNRISNQIYKCLLCEKTMCMFQTQETIIKHNNSHDGNYALIGSEFGEIRLYLNGKFLSDKFVYQNYLGENLENNKAGIKLQKYKLNRKRYEKIRNMILSYSTI